MLTWLVLMPSLLTRQSCNEGISWKPSRPRVIESLSRIPVEFQGLGKCRTVDASKLRALIKRKEKCSQLVSVPQKRLPLSLLTGFLLCNLLTFKGYGSSAPAASVWICWSSVRNAACSRLGIRNSLQTLVCSQHTFCLLLEGCGLFLSKEIFAGDDLIGRQKRLFLLLYFLLTLTRRALWFCFVDHGTTLCVQPWTQFDFILLQSHCYSGVTSQSSLSHTHAHYFVAGVKFGLDGSVS